MKKLFKGKNDSGYIDMYHNDLYGFTKTKE